MNARAAESLSPGHCRGDADEESVFARDDTEDLGGHEERNRERISESWRARDWRLAYSEGLLGWTAPRSDRAPTRWLRDWPSSLLLAPWFGCATLRRLRPVPPRGLYSAPQETLLSAPARSPGPSPGRGGEGGELGCHHLPLAATLRRRALIREPSYPNAFGGGRRD